MNNIFLQNIFIDNIMINPAEGETLPSSLTKDEVNSVIVSMRPAVAQAKVHIIHQHARHIKNLKTRKCSSDKQKEQNERKVARYVQEIELLKKSSRYKEIHKGESKVDID